MFHQSWNNAEKLLVNAQRWVFVGYSLPAADYEFKYLLKRIELSRAANPPDIILVTGGDAASTTRKNYRRFLATTSTSKNSTTDSSPMPSHTSRPKKTGPQTIVVHCRRSRIHRATRPMSNN
jgi:hypothetical protein